MHGLAPFSDTPDEELIALVLDDETASPREVELVLRLIAMTGNFDDLMSEHEVALLEEVPSD